MPTNAAETWFPVLLQAVLAAVIAAALVALSYLIGKRFKNKVKDMPYECGIAPTGDARERFSVKFYLVAMLFILFDIEAIFLYPWVVVYKDLNHAARLFPFIEMFLFVILILAGFFFIWKKGVLDWADSGSAPQKPTDAVPGSRATLVLTPQSSGAKPLVLK